MDKTNRYRKPIKHEAYEDALELAAEMTPWDLDNFGQDDLRVYLYERMYSDGLTYADARDVAAKAVRVTRGRRMRER